MEFAMGFLFKKTKTNSNRGEVTIYIYNVQTKSSSKWNQIQKEVTNFSSFTGCFLKKPEKKRKQ